jgi:GTP-binding protein
MPKIANYPFTTLQPVVGYVKFLDGYSYSITDLPGIIEDSHKNKGLGLKFLRHIERTKVLAFLVDISEE